MTTKQEREHVPSKECWCRPRTEAYGGDDERYAAGYRRGYDVATSRAESRFAMGLPIAYGEDIGLPPIED